MNKKDSNAERTNRSAFFRSVFFRGWVTERRGAFWPFVLLLLAFVTQLLEHGTLTAQQSKPKSQEKVSQAQIAGWINELSDDSFLIRNRAKTKLRQAGEKAFSQLYRARKSEDLETRLTVQELLNEIEIIWVWDGDSKEVEDMMLDFQFRKLEDRLALVDRLSWLATSECWSALFRIMIYDPSDQVSELAAARLMEIVFLRDKPFDSEIVENYLKLAQVYSPELKEGERLGQQICDASFEAVRSSQGLGLKNTFLVRAISALGEIVEDAKVRYPKNKMLRDALFLQVRSLYSVTESIADAKRFRMMGDIDAKLLELLELETANETLGDEYIIRLVRLLLDNQRTDAAEKLFTMIDLKKHGLVVGFLAARLNWQTKDSAAAEKISAEVVTRIESVSEVYMLFEELDSRRMKRSAIYLMESGVGVDRAPMLILTRLAEIYLEEKNLEKSRTIAQAIMRNSSDFDQKIRASWMLSKISRANDDTSSEISWLEQLLKLDPLSAVALVRLNELKAIKDFDKTWLERKVSIAKGAFRDQFRVGSQMSRSSTPAEENLGKVKMASAANSLAWLLANLNEDLAEAHEMARVAVGLEPRNPNFLDSLAYCEFQGGNRKAAISLQKRAIYLAPDNLDMKKRLDKYLDRN